MAGYMSHVFALIKYMFTLVTTHVKTVHQHMSLLYICCLWPKCLLYVCVYVYLDFKNHLHPQYNYCTYGYISIYFTYIIYIVQ